LIWFCVVGMVSCCWFGFRLLVWFHVVGLVFHCWFGFVLLVLFHVVALVLCCCFGLLVWFYVVGLVLCCWFSCWFCDWFGFMLLVWFSLVGFVLFCCSLFLFVIEFCVVGFGLVYSRWCCLSLMLKKVVSVLITIRVSCFPGTEYEQIQSYHW